MPARRWLIAMCALVWGVALPGVAAAQAGPEWLLGPEIGRAKFNLSYDSTLYPDQGISGETTDMGMIQHRVRGFAPLTQSDRHEWALFGGVKALDIDTRAILPTTRNAFPDGLWDISVGTAARWKLDSGWILGGNLQVGSPSDEPFASFEEMTLTADALLRVPWSKEWAGIFLLNYSTARDFAPDFPLPGFVLAYEPDRSVSALLGVPFSSFRWTPVEGLELSASYIVVRTVRAQVSYRLFSPLRLFAGFDWDSQRFFRCDRVNEDDRLSYYEKRLGGGLRWDPTPNLFAEASGGYAFDRLWFEGEKYSDRANNRLDIDDGLGDGFRGRCIICHILLDSVSPCLAKHDWMPLGPSTT